MLEFGTVAWEIAAMRHLGLDAEHGVEIETVPAASPGALNVALQAGRVDLIVSDWIWVSRQRSEGRAYQAAPYSSASGALVAGAGRNIRNVGELEGLRLGVAGGPEDKSWLLLRAYYLEHYGRELADAANVSYGAPPLIGRMLERGRLDAVLTFWHYAARLDAAGMTPVIDVADLYAGLGLDTRIPMLVWVFPEALAVRAPDALKGFLAASREARERLCEDDGQWQRIRGLTRAADPVVRGALRESYCAALPEPIDDGAAAAAARLFLRLAEIGGRDLVGDAEALAPDTFWQSGDGS